MTAQPMSLHHLVSLRLECLIRRSSDRSKTPSCDEFSALTPEQRKRAEAIIKFISEELPAKDAEDMLHRVLKYDGEKYRKASPMDAFVLLHPLAKILRHTRDAESLRKSAPLPNTHKALLEALPRCRYLEMLDLTGMDDYATTFTNNDLAHSSDCREHYLRMLEKALRGLPLLTSLSLGTLVTNAICRAVAETSPHLRELRMCGPAPKVSDLGLRCIAGETSTNSGEGMDQCKGTDGSSRTIGCMKLVSLSIVDVESVSLGTLCLLLRRLSDLRSLEHDRLHEALLLMHKESKGGGNNHAHDEENNEDNDDQNTLNLRSYRGRLPAHSESRYLEALRRLCPKIESLALGYSTLDTLTALARFRNIKSLVIARVSTMENFDLPLMAFGSSLVCLDLRNVCNFQSGTALHIRKYCGNLTNLVLEIDPSDGGGGGNSSGALAEALNAEQQSVWMLQNQVQDLQSRLNQLQVTMLSVMDKYGPMEKLEHLSVCNLSMGSVLILLPFSPYLKTLSMKYQLGDGDTAPNLTDELFLKIFKKNKFEHLELLLVWCKTLSARTARWFVANCMKLSKLKNLSLWDVTDDEAVQLWREGKNRRPMPVDVDF